jgi:hypothetical protein
MEEKLFEILDFILNQATEKEIIAIKAALSRRETKSVSPSGKSLNDMVTNMASSMNERLKVPIDGIRNSVKDMVIRIIRENAPEISEDELNSLLAEWVPQKKKRAKAEGALPGEAIISMLRSFIAYSLNSMSKIEDAKLRDQLGDWPERYWAAFPESIRALVSRYLKAKIDERVFWNEVFADLGIDPGESES